MAQIVKRKNKNGSTSYLFRVSTGYDRNGKQVTTSRTFTPPPTLTGRKLEKEVRRRADEFEQEVHNGLALDADMKLDDLIDRWFSEYIDKKCKPKTGVEYRYLRTRISAALGHMRVSQIRPSHLMAFYSSLEEAGARRDSVYLATPALLKELPRGKRQETAKAAGVGGRTMTCVCNGTPVSRASAEKVARAAGVIFSKAFTEQTKEGGKLNGNTVQHYHRMLSSVFTKAVQWGIVEDNPVKRAEPPKGEAVEVSYLEEADAARLLAALHDAPPQYSAMVQLGLFTGMRRGEICGLRWSDIDFNASTISVNRTVEYIPHEGLIFTAPKTKASNRTFKVGANCMDMLREYQLYQKAERLRVGSMWARTVQVENGKTVQNDLLFTSWDGTPFDLERLTTWFPHFLRAHDLPAVHFHSLRHPYVKPTTKKFITFFEVFRAAS